jgi:hypothetical protein
VYIVLRGLLIIKFCNNEVFWTDTGEDSYIKTDSKVFIETCLKVIHGNSWAATTGQDCEMN